MTDGNVISASGYDGLDIGYAEVDNTIYGNEVGTDTTGTVNLGNGHNGVLVVTGTNGLSIGGNVIAHNGDFGVAVSQAQTGVYFGSVFPNNPTNGVQIEGNSIYGNGVLGIDLGGTYDIGSSDPNCFALVPPLPGVLLNDSQGHSGPNNLQNFPVLDSAVSSATATAVVGTFSEAAEPHTTITLDFYANPAADPSGYGQGQRWFGSTTVTTDSNGHAVFGAVLPVGSLAGQWITATATDSSGNTSEFALDIQAAAEQAGGGLQGVTGQSFLDTRGVPTGGVLATFTDPHGAEALIDCSATLNWGDNSGTDTTGVITYQGGGVFAVSGNHTYATAGNYTVTVTLTHDGLPSTVQDPMTVYANPTVVNTNDSGPGSLRRAINDANYLGSVYGGTTLISFALPTTDPGYSAGAFTITPQSALPAITEPVTIDGTTEGGYTGTPLIVLNGSQAAGDGLDINAGSSTVKGLVINQFTGDGIFLSGNGDTVFGCYIGTDVTGNVALGNGTGLTGVGGGIEIEGSGNTISGDVISGNSRAGVYVGISATGNQIVGNLIGTNTAGNAALPNNFYGVWLSNESGGNTVGGTTPAQRNIISGNSVGVFLFDINVSGSATGDTVEGNFIGTDVSGTHSLPNTSGVAISRADYNTIGGTAPGAGNVISGNLAQGVVIANTQSFDNVVQDNLIGTDVTGTQALGNGGLAGNSSVWSGVRIANNSAGNTISGNVISYNTGDGVRVTPQASSASVDNSIRANSIYANTGLGIDLGGTGVPVPNDSQGHSGPNNYQNFPMLTSASSSSTSTVVAGTFSEAAEANMTLTLDFYANLTADPSGYGQGQKYLGSRTVYTDGSGNVSFTADLAVGNLASQWISATATDPNGNTSEFALDIQANSAASQTFTQNLPGSLPQSSVLPNTMTIQADPTTINDVVSGLSTNNLGSSVVPVSVYLNLAPGTYQSQTIQIPQGMTLYINGQQGTTIDPASPALTIVSGTVIVSHVIFVTTGDAPTILVTGGNVTLLNDNIIQASTVYNDPAISITGGTVNLGTASTPGNDTLSVSNSGGLIINTSGNAISIAGDTFEVGGTVLPAPPLTSTTLASSSSTSIPGQLVTMTATVAANAPGSGTPTGSVIFTDTTTNTILGTVTLSGGVATLSTSALALGTHVIQASYTGGSNFLPSLASLTQTVTQAIFVLNGTASGALSVSGTASINVPGSVIVDSNAKKALTESGNASIKAASIQVVGGVSTSGNATLSPAAATGVAPVSDPLASLTGPSTSGLTNYGAVSYSSGTHTLNPGIYSSIKASGTASLTLNPGLYLIEGGGMTVTSNASISGSGVTIYNTSSNYPSNTGNYGGITLSGNGTFSLSAPTSGAYAGIVIFQPYANTRAISLSVNAASGLTGTIYAPAALLYVSGNINVNGALVVNELSLSGNAASTQTAAGSNTDNAGSTAGQLVQGDVNVYVNNSNGDLTSDELARIQDAVNAVDAVTAPYGVNVAEVTNPTQANVSLNMGTTSAAGNYGQGVLGCYTTAGVITLLQGWNWYAGADPTQIGANQYDFQTTVTHELGHALGLGESSDPTSAMYGTLAPATTIRTLTTADLNIPYAEAGADAQRAAVLPVNAGADPASSQNMAPASSTSVPAGVSPASAVSQVFADLSLLLSDARIAYQSGLSMMSAMWQQADALALQRLDSLLGLEAGAMGVTKDTLMRDLLFASSFSANRM